MFSWAACGDVWWPFEAWPNLVVDQLIVALFTMAHPGMALMVAPSLLHLHVANVAPYPYRYPYPSTCRCAPSIHGMVWPVPK